MEMTEAWKVIGLEPTQNAAIVRTRYLARLVEVHPDRSGAADANEATATLNRAYRLVVDHLTAVSEAAIAGDSVRSRGTGLRPDRAPSTGRASVAVSMTDDDTIAVAAPPGETWALLVETCHEMGEVDHLEPENAIASVVVQFLEGPTCQLLFTLQGRGTGVTEIWCTAESFNALPTPPIDAITRLVLDTLMRVSRR